jgi:flagellar L-ring protein precursor FlgH
MMKVFLILLLLAIPLQAGLGDEDEISTLEEYLRQARRGAGEDAPQGGSLFSTSSRSLFLFVDVKARTLNDIVTIQILEASSASNSANTSTDREGNTSASAPSFFGLETGASALNFASLLEGLSNMSFEGQGTTSRSGSLTASISARVVEVLPNGDLVLEGAKEVAVNDERHILTLRGVVRPRDVNSDNLVLSTSIAHMEVQFDGSGIVSDANEPGFFYKLFSAIIPF